SQELNQGEKTMALRKQIQLRKGTAALSILKDEVDGKVLLSFDKDFVSRRVKGPLFSESEVLDLVELVREYTEWESKAMHGKHASGFIREAEPVATYDRALAQAEIERAIA